MEAFDKSVVDGTATEGDRQNGKGDYFNDLVAVILENSSGTTLNKRTGVPGLIFPNHSLDVTYPDATRGDVTKIVQVLVEAKMLGTPQHPGNASTQKPEGRNGSADLLKRCKEAGFKAIDLKTAYGMLQSQAGLEQQPELSGDLTTWLHSVKPRSFLVAAVRVTSPADAKAVVTMMDNMRGIMDGVGLFMYQPRDYATGSLYPPAYKPAPVPPTLEMTRLLQRVTTQLRAAAKAPGATRVPEPPSVATKDALEDAE